MLLIGIISLYIISSHLISSRLSPIVVDWKTSSAQVKSMLATERFVVEIDDIAREQVRNFFYSFIFHHISYMFLLLER